MNSKKILTLGFMLIATAIISLGFFSTYFTAQPMLRINKGDSYAKLWGRVDSCEMKGLTQSALDLVNVIYGKAKSENNAAQFVKAILKRMKFESQKEEFSLEKSIFKLRDETEAAHFPVKPVLQSILADAFWQYYQNNRWKFYERSATVNFKNNDISTWDLNTITNTVIKTYKASLENADSLKHTKLDIYDDIIVKGTDECRRWRPTLYDFLAHRALGFFSSSEPDVTRPANRFTVNDEKFLLPYGDFLNVDITNKSDSLETKYYALRLMQDLTKFHKDDSNPEALMDVELQRLDFVFNNSQNPKKDTLYFNSLHALENKFSSNPRITEINVRLANWYVNKASEYKPLESDNYKWHKKTAKEICDAAMKKFPDSYGGKECRNLSSSILTKNLNLIIEQVNEPSKPFRALITSTNISKLYFKIVKTTHLELRKMYRTDYGDKLYNRLNALPVVKTFEQAIPDDNDYQSHNTEIRLPALDAGYYVIISSLNPDFKYSGNLTSYAPCVVSDITTIERRNDEGNYDFYALHRQTGEPLKNITVQVWHEKYNYTSRDYEIKKGDVLKSDDKGHFSITYKTEPDRSFFVELINGNDSYFNDNNYYVYNPGNSDRSQTRSYIFTDRGIYRPGQTVYFKSIVIRTNNDRTTELMTKKPLTVTFYDVNYQKISSLNLTTNEYGTVSGSFTAPQGVLTGQMQITDGISNTYVSVEEYKRPKFEATFNPVKGAFRLNDEVAVSGMAKAYAGNAIDGAKVNYRVTRRVQYPYWWYWYRPYYPSGSDAEILNGETVTNDTGAFFINFKALPDESVSKESQAYYTYEVSADVVDLNGETHSAGTSVTVGYTALNLSVDAAGIIDQDKATPIQIYANNLNGVPEATKGSFSIYRLKQPAKPFRSRLWEQPDRHTMTKEEYYADFPNDLYADELNKYKWEKESKVLDKAFDTGAKNEYDLATEIKAMKPGMYVLEAICKDKFGNDIKAYAYFTVFSAGNSTLPEPSPDWFYYPKAIAEPGEKVSFILASAYPNTNYLYEIELKDKLVSSTRIAASMKPVEIAITEEHRGNIAFHTTFVKFNRFYSHSSVVEVPYTNKMLDIELQTFRNKLLPGQSEEWKLVLKDKKGEKAAAEMVATMYDASLDAFRGNSWYFDIYQSYYARLGWNSTLALVSRSIEFNNLRGEYISIPSRYYDRLDYFGLAFYNYDGYGYGGGKNMESSFAAPTTAVAEMKVSEESEKDEAPRKKSNALGGQAKETTATGSHAAPDVLKEDVPGAGDKSKGKSGGDLGDVAARSNFNETAFFFPHLETNEKGEVVIRFTVPESLTKWKVMGFAHTKDLKVGQFEREVVTQKDLMVQPNAPRFFREGDRMTFISKVVNLSENELKGGAELKLFDALTEQEISTKMMGTASSYREFSTKKGASSTIEWELQIPENYQAIKYKIVAKAGSFSDGEEMALPVLTNRMLVTESMPLPIRSNQIKEFSFTKFISQNNNSTTLKNHSYTLEFTANPAWYAVQALPYLMEYPYECAEQSFARYYANSLASYVVNSKPKIKAIFESWKSLSPDAFLSNLEKNQELKSLVLEETPWVLQAQNESENKKRVGLLFDLNRMAGEQARALKKVMNAQTPNGGFWWFEGGPDDWYITQHIACGFGHLDKLGVLKIKDNSGISSMLEKAVHYCDDRMREEYEQVKKYYKNYKTENHLSYMIIHYMYMRSFYKDLNLDKRNKEAFDYYKAQSQKYWLQEGRYAQGMIALSLNRNDDKKTPKDILKSLKENSLNNEEMGMYWKENYGYYWYEAPIEMQALMIEAFDEINNDAKAVDDMKTWLIKSKQTQHWGTTRATTEAVYAMLLKGSDWLATEPNVVISVGDIKLDPKNDPGIKPEPGTGYFKKAWTGSDIRPATMGKIKVEKKDQGVSYGAVYWQYFEQLDKITPHETPLKIKKQLFVQRNTAGGPVIEPLTADTRLKLGDKIKVRIELRVDRDMSYVHMKDMRAAGFEPTNVISSYKWQDGLDYYESTRDAATNFFFPYLNKGTYVFEYPMVVNHYGDFSNGVTTIQCMYAPEFTSHSEGVRVSVKKN